MAAQIANVIPGSRSRQIKWTIVVADTGVAVDVSDLENMVLQVTSAGAGTAQIRASVDGTNFVGLTAALAIGAAAPAPVGLAQFPVGFVPKAIDVSAVATADCVITIIGQVRPPAGA